MSLEDSLRAGAQRNREDRAIQSSRFSSLLNSIVNGTEYDFDPQQNADGSGGLVSGQKGETGIGNGTDRTEGAVVRTEATGEAANG